MPEGTAPDTVEAQPETTLALDVSDSNGVDAPDIPPEGIAPDPRLMLGETSSIVKRSTVVAEPDIAPEGVVPEPVPATAPMAETVAPPSANGKGSRPAGIGRVVNLRNVVRPALRIFRWVMGALALFAAFWGQAIAEEARQKGFGAPPQSSWIMFGVAGLLFAVAMWPVPRVLPAVSATFFKTLFSLKRARKLLFLVPLALSIILGLIALPLFMRLNAGGVSEPVRQDWWTNTGSWLLYITALLLFAFAFIVWERSVPPTYSKETPQPGDRLPVRLEWGVVGALFLLALLLRVPGLENAPPGLWFDEAQNGLVARQLMDPNALHPAFISEKTQMGALYFYLQGIVLQLFGMGNPVWPLRIIPALGGALIAPMLYLLATRLYGWRVGLAAGGLVAVSAWNITFSRVGFASLATVAVNVAVYLCVAQALRTGRLGYYAAGGVLMGLAMQSYYVARLIPFVLAAVLVHRLVTERLRVIKALRSGLIVFAIGALLAFMPVGLFALQQPEVYNARVDEVSIFKGGGGGDPQAFEKSVNSHALMFNFFGDRNGRHNLPGTPMLDWLVAALFFSGLASCILRAWRWQYFFPIPWLAASVSGGVLSLLFEAPQAHRALEASVVVSLIAGIFLGELWQLLTRAWSPAVEAEEAGGRTLLGRLLRRKPAAATAVAAASLAPADASLEAQHIASAGSLQPSPTPKPATTLPTRKHPARDAATALPIRQPSAPKPAAGSRSLPSIIRGPWSVVRRLSGPKPWAAIITSALGILAAVAWSGVANGQKYFNAQLKDRAVWKEMYSAEAEAGRMLARYGKTHDVYVTPIYHAAPPTLYLAPGLQSLDWKGMHALPFAYTASRDAVIVLDPPSAADLAMIARLYPNAKFEVLQTPLDPEPLIYTVFIPANDINSLQGAHAVVYGADPQRPALDTTIPSLDFNWSVQGVTSGTLRLTSTFRADRFGPHTFEVRTAGGAPAEAANLLIDGYEVGAGTPITLVVGIHTLVLTDTVGADGFGGGSGVTSLLWSPPAGGGVSQPIPPANVLDPRKVEPRGLTGIFRDGVGFAGPPRDGRLETVISAYFHNTPLPRPYTADWSGNIYIPEAGSYTFGTEQLSRSVLYLDDKELINNSFGNNLIENTIALTQGWHKINMKFEDYEGYSHVYLYWIAPGKERAVLPSAYLWPEMGRYPDKLESGPFPTLDEYDGKLLPAERVIGAHLPLRGSGQMGNAITNPPPITGPPPQMSGNPIEPLYAFTDPTLSRLPVPFAVTADEAGNLYVFSVADSKIRKFGGSGELVAEWAAQSAEGAPLIEVSAMLAYNNTLLALDAERSELLTYGADGTLQGRRQMCACYYPRGMHLARDGNFWVSDTGGGRVIKVGAEGQLLSTLGDRGSEPGKFVEPVSIWETPGGIVYVADVGNQRVQSFSPDGKPLAQWPMGVSNSRDGNRLAGDGENVLVTDGESRSVIRYDSQGKELGRWSIARGEVLVPSGIAPVGGGRFAVLYLKHDYGIVFKP